MMYKREIGDCFYTIITVFYTAVTLLSHDCYTVCCTFVTLMLHSLLHCCHTDVTLLLHCDYTVVTLMLHCLCTGIVTLLLHCVGTVGYNVQAGMLRHTITIVPDPPLPPAALCTHCDPLGGEIVTRAEFSKTTVTPQ
jgi:hypothetical protein